MYSATETTRCLCDTINGSDFILVCCSSRKIGVDIINISGFTQKPTKIVCKSDKTQTNLRTKPDFRKLAFVDRQLRDTIKVSTSPVDYSTKIYCMTLYIYKL